MGLELGWDGVDQRACKATPGPVQHLRPYPHPALRATFSRREKGARAPLPPGHQGTAYVPLARVPWCARAASAGRGAERGLG
ncbi:hypothetical protein XHV734_1259 [Xanthomonas hortorum pv. vitians]|nr:hypothetical protein XHV734_1259 [Xanthomonas hortorum pv. vitians]